MIRPLLLLAALPLACAPVPAAAPVPAPVPAAASAPAPAPAPDRRTATCTSISPPAAPAALALPPLPLPTGLIARIAQRGGPLSAELLATTLTSHRGAPFLPESVAEDLRRLWALELFDDLAVEAELGPAGVVVTYVLTERPRLGSLFFAGVHALPEAELTERVRLLAAPRLDRIGAARSAESVRARYVEEGYRHATIEPRTRRAEDGALDLCLTVTEGARVVVASWAFTGNAAVSTAEITALRRTDAGRVNAPGGVYREDLWERDALALTALYLDRGMIQADVGAPGIVASPDGAALAITVPITEGPVFHVGSVKLAGRLGKSAARRYEPAIHARKGDVFRRTTLGEDLDRLRLRLREGEGRDLEVTPRTEIDVAHKTVHLTYVVEDPPL